jgi:hypothetical protein
MNTSTSKPETDRIQPIRAAFFKIGGVLLGITGFAKLLSICAHARILTMPDPIFDVPFRQLMIVAGVVELLVFVCCWSRMAWKLKAFLVAWLSTIFIVYHLGLWIVHYRGMCPCLGTLTDALRVSPTFANVWLNGIIIYLACGSFGFLTLDGIASTVKRNGLKGAAGNQSLVS